MSDRTLELAQMLEACKRERDKLRTKLDKLKSQIEKWRDGADENLKSAIRHPILAGPGMCETCAAYKSAYNSVLDVLAESEADN